MKRVVITAVTGLILIGAIAGGGSHTAATPTPSAVQVVTTAAQHGWGPQEVKVAMEAFEQDAPNATRAQDQCAFAYESAHYTPSEVLHLSAAANTQLGEDEAHACEN